jgi:uncharacterized protein (UPF0276 family)
MSSRIPNLGLGIGWRPELALAIDRRPDLGFVELMAEDFEPSEPLSPAIERLRRRGVRLVPHGVSLSLGGAEPLDRGRLDHLARLARSCDAPLVSEHIAFVRADGTETGHLLPIPRTRAALEVVVAHVREAQAVLPVPLALENIATLIEWPENEFDEATFLTEILERTDALLLLDIENVYANARNYGPDPLALLDHLPLERLAYVHIAGGHDRDGLYHDTHTDPVPTGVLTLLEELANRCPIPGVMLERDGRFPSQTELDAELDAIAGAARRGVCHVG